MVCGVACMTGARKGEDIGHIVCTHKATEQEGEGKRMPAISPLFSSLLESLVDVKIPIGDS